MADFKSKYTGPQIEDLLDSITLDGRTFVIKDIFPTLEALEAAYPTGNEYAYQVEADRNIYLWSENNNAWESLGQIEGPQGPAGEPGQDGTDGKSAYQSAVDGGYTGTEAEFNTILATAQSQIGKLSNLPTTEKSNLVGAITEVNASLNWDDIIRNPDFVNPINQRTVSGTISALGYFIDCWKLVSGTVTLTANGLQLNGTIAQIFETDVPSTLPHLEMYSGTATASYDGGTKTLSITSSGGVIKYVNKPFSDRGAELAKCQRYFYRTYKQQYQWYAIGMGISTTRADFQITFPQAMRLSPTLTYSGDFILLGTSSIAVTSLARKSFKDNQLFLSATVASGLTVGQVYKLANADASVDAYMDFSAEL